MSYKLFIDDERFPVNPKEWCIVRSSLEACAKVQQDGLPSFISFDHDLGGDDTSRKFIYWLIDYLIDNNDSFPKDFKFYVHSQNPIGAEWLRATMDSIIEEFKEQY